MRVDDDEKVAAIERLAEGEESDIAEGTPIATIDESDTIPNEDLGDDSETEEGDDDEAPDDDAPEDDKTES